MSNLLKAEFYKLFHSWYFWGIGLFNLLLSSVLLLDSVGETSNLFFASIYNMPILYFLTIIFSALFVGNDFGRRTLQSYFRDIGKSMAVPMVLFFLMVFLMNGDQVQLISQILPMGQLRLMALQQSNISGGQFMFSDFLWVLALCLGTYLWFRRSDLK